MYKNNLAVAVRYMGNILGLALALNGTPNFVKYDEDAVGWVVLLWLLVSTSLSIVQFFLGHFAVRVVL